MEYKERWIYKLSKYSWTILVPVLIALWVSVWKLPNLAPYFSEMAVIGTVVAVVGLAAITHQHSVHTRELANTTREQCDAARKLAEISEKALAENKAQARQNLRPVVVPEIVQTGEVAWELWRGNLILRNGGNGPAIQLRLKIVIGESLVWQKELCVLITGQSDISDINLPFASKLVNTANGNGTKIEYRLEVDWSSAYEKERSRCRLPFSILIDAKGHPKVSVSALEFEWPDSPLIRAG